MSGYFYTGYITIMRYHEIHLVPGTVCPLLLCTAFCSCANLVH